MRTPSLLLLVSTGLALLGAPALRSADTAPLPLDEARAAIDAREFDRAAQLLEPAAKSQPPSAAVCALLAQARLGQKNAKDAVVWAQKAADLEPNRAGYHILLGSALGQRIGELPFLQQAFIAGKLRRAFARAVELEPENISGLIGLARYHANAPQIAGGDLAKARDYAERVRRLEPFLGWLELAHIAEKDENPAQALTAYEAAEKLKPGNAGVVLGIARALIALGRNDEARARLERIPAGGPSHAEAQKLLGTLQPPSRTRVK